MRIVRFIVLVQSQGNCFPNMCLLLSQCTCWTYGWDFCSCHYFFFPRSYCKVSYSKQFLWEKFFAKFLWSCSGFFFPFSIFLAVLPMLLPFYLKTCISCWSCSRNILTACYSLPSFPFMFLEFHTETSLFFSFEGIHVKLGSCDSATGFMGVRCLL